MKRTIIITCLLAIVTLTAAAQVGKIVFEEPAKKVIEMTAAEPRILTSVPMEGIEKQGAIFREWAAAFINLEKAEKRESRVFNRISYIQEQNYNLPFYIGEEFKPVSNPEKLNAAFRTLYQESPTQFSLVKLKEEKSSETPDEKKLLELGKEFLIKNHFLIQSEEDQIADYEVLTANFNMEGEKKGMPPVVMAGQQDLILYRNYNKRPVFNSSALIGILPENGEVVELSLSDWSPVDSYRQIRLSPGELKELGIYNTGQIIKKIKKLINMACGPAEKAVVTGIIPGYFQTDEWLYPVIGIELIAEFKGDKESFTKEYFESVNLGGKDDIFAKDYRQPPGSVQPKK